MKANLIITLTIMFLVWLSPTTARTYRWVDENGQTVYSQSRPPSGKATVIKPPPPPPPASSDPSETMKKLKARLDALNKDKEEENKAKEKEEKAAKSTDIKKQNCETATANLKNLQSHGRLRMKMDDGSYKILTEEERIANIERAKSDIKKFCK